MSSAIISCHLDEKTPTYLERIAKELDRTVEDLAECAISEAVLSAANERGWHLVAKALTAVGYGDD